jgi:hypothetical protein
MLLSVLVLAVALWLLVFVVANKKVPRKLLVFGGSGGVSRDGVVVVFTLIITVIGRLATTHLMAGYTPA